MDDLKVFITDKYHLEAVLNIITEYTRDVRMPFGLDKCVVAHLARGKCSNASEDVELIDGRVLKHLKPESHFCIEEKKIHFVSDVKTQRSRLSAASMLGDSERSGHQNFPAKIKSSQQTCLLSQSCYTLLGS